MTIRPLNDRIAVKRVEAEETAQAGIIVPDSAKEKPREAEVKAIGPGKLLADGQRAPVDIGLGDRILFGKYAGSEIRLGDEDLVIFREDEVLAVLGKLGVGRSL
jgi:chaperonin GroES